MVRDNKFSARDKSVVDVSFREYLFLYAQLFKSISPASPLMVPDRGGFRVDMNPEPSKTDSAELAHDVSEAVDHNGMVNSIETKVEVESTNPGVMHQPVRKSEKGPKTPFWMQDYMRSKKENK
ncbi:hypothetical protein HAX54_020556 [Datura stramonium]|uniref:Uncharacterized protein n=1 Tax=Datura stramonium TaxID=4076 RepID=A0ABS8US40_DATST|nr:hypothetical protein [Datura stramonium]